MDFKNEDFDVDFNMLDNIDFTKINEDNLDFMIED